MAIGNKTLQDLLAPISEQLGHETVAESIEPPVWEHVPWRVTDGMSHDELVDTFIAEAAKVQTPTSVCTRDGLAECIAGIVGAGTPETGEPCSVVCAHEAAFEEAGLVEALRSCDKVSIVNVWGDDSDEACIDAAREATYGITYATAGIAESATVVQPMGAGCGRSVSLLPLVHIAVLDAATIVPTMREVMEQYAAQDEPLPDQICLISGPSATADIELVRVQGVHGPMYVHYVLIRDE